MGKFGDECTRFFHANASIKHNRNTITSIRSTDGSVLTNHEDKALFIWNSFKERLGISEFSSMNIDLATLITSAQNLDWLHGEFSGMRLIESLLISPTISPQVLMVLMENF
jgi:hypothetical protein